MRRKYFFRHCTAYVLNLPVIRDITPASWYVSLRFYEHFGYHLNLKNPRTFNEKMQWLKVHNHRPEFTIMVDKYGVRDYVANKIGGQYLIPLVGGPWERFEDIDFDVLPEQFVLKCTHDSASVVICTDKSKFDYEAARYKLITCLRYNFYWFGREWPYKNVKPRIVAEKYMVDESGTELKDYKVFCFGGEPKIIQVNFDRFSNPHKNMYSTNWEYLPITSHFPTNSNAKIAKPEKLDSMLTFARQLSEGIPFLRVDFYSICSQVYFGELTFFPGSGFINYEPVEWNEKFGSWITLP